MTKYEKMLKKRMENIDNYVIPPNEFHLPSIPEGAIAAFSFSLADGVKLRVSYIFWLSFVYNQVLFSISVYTHNDENECVI